MNGPCPICRGHAQLYADQFEDARVVECAQCGTFKVSRTAIVVLEAIADTEIRRQHLEDAKGSAKPGEAPFIRNI